MLSHKIDKLTTFILFMSLNQRILFDIEKALKTVHVANIDQHDNICSKSYYFCTHIRNTSPLNWRHVEGVMVYKLGLCLALIGSALVLQPTVLKVVDTFIIVVLIILVRSGHV